MDEYLVHQAELPLARVVSDHPDWQDRFYFNIHDAAGDFAAITGLGAYPNRGYHQAYMFVVHNGVHYNYLNIRPLNADRDEMYAGSLRFEVIEPLKSWRLEVADEANGIEASLQFDARCPLYTFSPVQWQNRDRTVVNQLHYTQSGRYTGTFRIGESTWSDGLTGMRDRSWGIRAMAEVPMWIWVSAQFPTYNVTAWLWETPEGEVIHQDGAIVHESGEIQPIKTIAHELEFASGRKCPSRGRYLFGLKSAETAELTAEGMSAVMLGPMLGGKWDESDTELVARADGDSFGFDQHCRFQMQNGDHGIGIIEYMFTGGVAKYSIPPAKPMAP